jgi:hypothetical protein
MAETYADDIDMPVAKKLKLSTTPLTKTTVFTCGVEDRHIQLLGVHTLYNLVDFIVQNELEETADQHLWHVKVGMRTYSSLADSDVVISTLSLVVGTALFLEYDYGSTSCFCITCLGVQSNVSVNVGEYPRYKPADPVADFAEYVPPVGSINLDVEFPTFSKWAFRCSNAKLNFFKAGQTHNFGFQERDTNGVCQMIYFPSSFDTLQDYLHALDYAARLKYSTDGGFPLYN